jgi:hypothetical protein
VFYLRGRGICDTIYNTDPKRALVSVVLVLQNVDRSGGPRLRHGALLIDADGAVSPLIHSIDPIHSFIHCRGDDDDDDDDDECVRTTASADGDQ